MATAIGRKCNRFSVRAHGGCNIAPFPGCQAGEAQFTGRIGEEVCMTIFFDGHDHHVVLFHLQEELAAEWELIVMVGEVVGMTGDGLVYCSQPAIARPEKK